MTSLMTQYHCLSIGINRYQTLQPLSFATADAQAVQQFLIDEGRISPEQILLLTDDSPWVEGRSTQPTYDNLTYWLSQIKGKVGSVFWFFFSGYGVSIDGEDYLVSIETEANAIPSTALPIRQVFQTLKNSGASQVVAILDINRSPAVFAGGVGEQTIHLAGEMGIALILSTHPQELSHEAGTLGQGLFTASLLEGLKYYRRDVTLGNLDQYLRTRLPELCEHHWRPPQKAITVIPTVAFAQQPILPNVLNPAQIQTFIVEEELIPVLTNGTSSANGRYRENNGTGTKTLTTVLNPPKLPKLTVVETEIANGSKIPTFDGEPEAFPDDDSEPPIIPPPEMPKANKSQDTVKGNWGNWWAWLLWGGGSIIMLILMSNQIMKRINSPDNPYASPQISASVSPSVTVPPSPDATSSPVPSAMPLSLPVVTPVPPEQQIQDNGGNSQVDFLPRLQLTSNSASTYNRAIHSARRIPPSDPRYADAQQSIERWSLAIWDIAQGRAGKGDFIGAMSAVTLIPKDVTSVYTKASQQIKVWDVKKNQQSANNNLIRKAKALIKPSSASSYQDALRLIEPISQGQPSFDQAQDLRLKWGKSIYLIAKMRANRGNYKPAISAMKLLPSYSPYYADGIKQMKQWEKKVLSKST